jgi:hypothetical protein
MSTKTKIDLLIEMNTELTTQNKTLHQQLQSQQKQIDELVKLNAEILVNTNKMGKHIDFINSAYEKITKSYFFKNLLG